MKQHKNVICEFCLPLSRTILKYLTKQIIKESEKETKSKHASRSQALQQTTS